MDNFLPDSNGAIFRMFRQLENVKSSTDKPAFVSIFHRNTDRYRKIPKEKEIKRQKDQVTKRSRDKEIKRQRDHQEIKIVCMNRVFLQRL